MTAIRKETHALIDTIPEESLQNVYEAILKLKALDALSGVIPADFTIEQAKKMRIQDEIYT